MPAVPAGVRFDALGRDEQLKPAITGHEAIGRGDLPVHKWRVAQLTRLGVPPLLAEVYADSVDWHQIAQLVQRGCPARLALRSAR
jgi:hypothetical protein